MGTAFCQVNKCIDSMHASRCPLVVEHKRRFTGFDGQCQECECCRGAPTGVAAVRAGLCALLIGITDCTASGMQDTSQATGMLVSQFRHTMHLPGGGPEDEEAGPSGESPQSMLWDLPKGELLR